MGLHQAPPRAALAQAMSLLLLLTTACAAAAQAGQQTGTTSGSSSSSSTPAAATYLQQNQSKYLQLLRAVGVDNAALRSMQGILLAPDNAAVDALAARMGMSLQQLLSSPLLVDQITAYHFLPGGRITAASPVRQPLLSRTADVNSIVRFYKDARSGRAWLTDMQGNNVTLRASPKVFCNLTIVPLSRVLMSGSFFASLDDALRLHPRLRTAHMLWQRAGGLGGPGSSSLDGVTVFAPVDAAFKASKQDVVSLSKDEARALLQAHSLKGGAGLRSLAQLQPGAKATLLTGSSSLKLDVATNGTLSLPWQTGKTVPRPLVTITDARGGQARAVMPWNVWAGKTVLHGIDRVLQPAAQQPRRVLLQDGDPADADPTTHFNGAWGSDNNPATALAAVNTVGAAYAAQNQYEEAYYALPSSPGWRPMNNWSTWINNA